MLARASLRSACPAKCSPNGFASSSAYTLEMHRLLCNQGCRKIAMRGLITTSSSATHSIPKSTHVKRHASSDSQSAHTSTSLDALFNAKVSRWSSIVGGDNQYSAATPRARQSASAKTTTPQPRRQTMTHRELAAFKNMFDMLFDAANQNAAPRQLGPTIGTNKSRPDVIDMDIFDRLRRNSKYIKWTSEEEDALDRKKEAMDLCETDQQLLEWAIREVFEESQLYEKKARTVLEDPTTSKESVRLQPLAYPHLVAELMKKFRDKYSDPHLSLSIFDYARNLSSLSYVFGCTTAAYNELIETRWSCFRDLRGVCDALDEMHINGVEMDSRTRALAERIRQEIGERNVWDEEMSTGSGEVMQMMNFIEKVTAKDLVGLGPKQAVRTDNAKKWNKRQERWKSYVLDESDDGYVFNRWDEPIAGKAKRTQRRPSFEG